MKKIFTNKYFVIVPYSIVIIGLILHYLGIDTFNFYWLTMGWIGILLTSLRFILKLIKNLNKR